MAKKYYSEAESVDILAWNDSEEEFSYESGNHLQKKILMNKRITF